MFGASYYSVVRNQEMNAKKPETETKESKGLLGWFAFICEFFCTINVKLVGESFLNFLINILN